VNKLFASAGLCLLLLLCACGGPQGALVSTANGEHATTPANPLAGGLPALGQLPVPARHASLSGPGWCEVPLAEMQGASGAALNGASVDLVGAAPLAYALYGVPGFDGDNGPTSAKAAVSAVTGEYYLAFSDYKNQRWAFAGPFTGSAEASAPQMDQHASVGDFVSPQGVCYIAVVLPPSGSLTLNKLELGVHGGTLGPLPPAQLSAVTIGAQARLDWTHSPSAMAPDFSGYLVERAPVLTGEFVSCNVQPQRADFFLDSGLALGEAYRFRVCSVDAGGNRSAWIEALAGPAADAMLGVVAQLDAPRGVLYGPATVAFDLSGSQALDGQPFTRYQLSILHGPSYESTDNPLFNVTLQPGCYTITATVEGSVPGLTSTDTTTLMLHVLPRWQAAPVVVRDATAPTGVALTRLQMLRGCLMPAGDAVLLGYDPTLAGLGIWRGQPAAQPGLTPLPLANVTAIGEPAQLGNQAYFPLATTDRLSLVRVGSGQPEALLNIPHTTNNPAVAAVAQAAQVWLLHSAYDGYASRWSLGWAQLTGEQGLIVDDTGGALGSMDAVYVPAANAIDIVYNDQDSTEWVRWDPAGRTIVASANLSGASAGAIDVELNPATGRPVLAYSISNTHYYRELDDMGAWSVEQPIDGAVTNYAPLDLAFDDGALCACFATWPDGNTRRYKLDAGVWSVANSVSFSGDDGYQLALLPLPGDPGCLVADVDNAGRLFFAKLTEGAADEMLWQIGATDGQGFELHGVAGSDGLHAVWRCVQENRARHYLSADGGATWQDEDPGLGLTLGAHDLDLSSTTDGNVYISLQDGLSSNLLAWDAGTQGISVRQSFPNSGAQRPYLSHNSSGIMWSAYDDGSATMHFFAGAALDTPVALTLTPVWDGVTNNDFDQPAWEGRFPSLIVQGSVSGAGWPRLSLLGYGAADSTLVAALPSTEMLLGPAVRGRTLDTTTYSTGAPSGSDARVAFFAAYGPGTDALRYELAPLDAPQLSALPIGAPAGGEARRTVSAAQAQGLTGVVLVSSLDGSRQLFQWSNFGEWQDIPLPSGLERAFEPELVVGGDGRWHILYKDWLTDQLLCWSTQ
jgi:hypothetical protein